MVDFPIWFNIGWYGGLTCCMFAIATNVLYSALRGRGRTRQTTPRAARVGLGDCPDGNSL